MGFSFLKACTLAHARCFGEKWRSIQSGWKAANKKPRQGGVFCHPVNPCRPSRFIDGAQKRTRTSTKLPPLAPEASASTNSATWAGVGAHFLDCVTDCQRMISIARALSGPGVPLRHDQQANERRAEVRIRQAPQGCSSAGEERQAAEIQVATVDAGSSAAVACEGSAVQGIAASRQRAVTTRQATCVTRSSVPGPARRTRGRALC